MSELIYQSANKQAEHRRQSGQASSNKSVLQDNREQTVQHKILTDARPATVQRNNTGMPDKLKTGIENLSGMNMDHVKVHYNSAKPAQLNAHAYAQGSQIHIAPGQEKHLPHEAWHVVQQAQGRVKPTMQMKAGIPINDNAGLEKEADVMGARALTSISKTELSKEYKQPFSPVFQKVDWGWWGRGVLGAAGAVAGGIGSVGGALYGAVSGGLEGHQKGSGIIEGAIAGLQVGAKEGYDKPGSTLGALAGGAVGHVVGTLTGLTAGYYGSLAGGASLGSAIGSNLNNKLGSSNTKTKIIHTAGQIGLINLKGDGQKTYHKVGKKMEAKLIANNPVQGSATGVNWTWMQFLRRQYPNANVVRGHLLNHDLGGFGMPENLYPISTLANAEHSTKVEQPVKKLLAQEITQVSGAKPVNYMVEVTEHSKENPQKATFNCSFGIEGQSKKHVPIPSDLGTDKGGFGGGKKINPLDGTSWHHGDRKGFESDELSKDLIKYSKNGNIEIINGKSHGVTPNEDAKYRPGGRLRTENEDNIYDNMAHLYFNRWSRELQKDVLTEMNSNAKDFKKGLLMFVRGTKIYKDNQGDPDFEFGVLIIDVLNEQLDKLIVKYQGDFDVLNELHRAKKSLK